MTYECGRMRQNVWSKRKWEATDEELAARKEASEAAKPIKRTREQAKELEQKLLDTIIKQWYNRINGAI